MKRILMVMTRYPEEGRCKKRLMEYLGRKGATKLHRQLVGKTMETCTRFSSNSSVALVVFYSGGNRRLMEAWLGKDVPFVPQTGTDLGLRMFNALRWAFEQGFKKAVIVGTDCPMLTDIHLTESFRMLEEKDVVIGPALDGGYYLIGMKGAWPELFMDVKWGCNTVFEITMERVKGLGLKGAFLDRLPDVDRPEDLGFLQGRFLKQKYMDWVHGSGKGGI